jgi:hypothetical protein
VNVYPFIEAEKRGRRNVKRACELLRVLCVPRIPSTALTSRVADPALRP